MKKRKHLVAYLSKNFLTILGIVLIWRGIWYVLDGVDVWLFNGEHTLSAVGGVILGFLCLYLPDKDLKEIEKI